MVILALKEEVTLIPSGVWEQAYRRAAELFTDQTWIGLKKESHLWFV